MKRKTPFILFIKQMFSHRVSRVLFHIFPSERKRGSAAIILSLMVSGAVLSTIFHSQKNIDWFLSTTKSSLQDWEKALTAKYAFTLGGYLVANNLILCKEDGWGDEKGLCQWKPKANEEEEEAKKKKTKEEEPSPAKFGLTEETIKTVNGKKTLSYTGKITGTIKDDLKGSTLRRAEDIKYSISFDLINWKDSAIKNIMGEIPESVCRNSQTLEIIPEEKGWCDPGQLNKPEMCKTKKGGPDIPNSKCEYISALDQDYYIVLMSVQPLDSSSSSEEEDKQKTVYHAGIRRPLAQVTAFVEGDIRCSLTCASGATAQVFPECRGGWLPPKPGSKGDASSFKVRVTNKGPGVLYNVVFLRKQTYHNTPNVVHYKKIGNILDKPFQEEPKTFLAPGESVTFPDNVACNQEIDLTITTSTETIRTTQFAWAGAAGGVPSPSQTTESSINENVKKTIEPNESFPFTTISYTMGPRKSPMRQCVNNKLREDEGQQIKGNCPAQYSTNSNCGANNKGLCLYAHIEPRRLFAPKESKKDIEKMKIKEKFEYQTTNRVGGVDSNPGGGEGGDPGEGEDPGGDPGEGDGPN